MKEPGKLVHVTWRDSCSPTWKWQDRDGIEMYGHATCFSVGWLLRDDKTDMVLAASYGGEDVGDVTAIPKGCVVKVRKLK